jgi:hypothetical protein
MLTTLPSLTPHILQQIIDINAKLSVMYIFNLITNLDKLKVFKTLLGKRVQNDHNIVNLKALSYMAAL